MVATSPTALVFRRSVNAGASFEPEKQFLPAGNNPQISASGANVYVTWEGRSQTPGIYFVRSADGGATFGPVQKLSALGSGGAYPSTAASGSLVMVTWMEQAVLLARSSDAGATFSNPQDVSSPATKALFPRVALADRSVYLAWVGTGPDGTPAAGIAARKSADGGATFNDASYLSTGNSTVKFDRFPMVTVGNNVILAWIGSGMMVSSTASQAPATSGQVDAPSSDDTSPGTD